MEIVPHSPAWTSEFEALASVLSGALTAYAHRVEHVGSTAVPGLAARPILDVDVVLADPACMDEAVGALAGLGYDHRGDLGVAGREAFGRVTAAVPFTPEGRTWMDHSLYLCAEGARELKRHLAFRDRLRRDGRAARSYEELKRKLAARWPDDPARYVAGKGNFIEALLSSR